MRIRFKAELQELDSRLRLERLREVEGLAPEVEIGDSYTLWDRSKPKLATVTHFGREGDRGGNYDSKWC